MTDVMPINDPDERIELLRIFREAIPGCDEQFELSRFLSFLRSIDKQWEGNSGDLKKDLLFKYLQSYIGEDNDKFRAGRDG